jgi:hypothetical protein
MSVTHFFAPPCDSLLAGLSCTKRLQSHLLPLLPSRLMDPQLATSYPSAIMARERAIVVNLEFIKCIVAMGEASLVFLLHPA